MKRAYYYFLFRIYRYYKDKEKETDFVAIFSTVALSTVFLFLNIFFIYSLVDYFDLVPMFTNKYTVVPLMIIIGCLNYYFFIKEKDFLKYKFKKDRRGGYFVIIYMILSLIAVFTVGYFNRQKIFSNMPPVDPHKPKQESLEGKIRDWIKDL